MNIAVDAMGGDFAPRNIVQGTLEASIKLSDVNTFYLVGDETTLRMEIDALGFEVTPRVEIVHAGEVVGMDEAPATALRRKKDSSIARAVDLVKEGKAEALFSAGNTGAAVAATVLKLRMLETIDRPAIATVMPTKRGPFILIDAGATPDCTPDMLAQYAVMGAVYAEEILGIPHPSVGLLSIGGEDTKGNETTKETFRLLKNAPLNFAGNVEGHDLYEGRVDVVVCDGFVGNVVLKTSESVAYAMRDWMKEEFTKNPLRILGALLLRNAFKSIRKKADPDMYGGAPLLGVNGICIIGHGSSSPRAVHNALRVASESISHDINHIINDKVRSLSNQRDEDKGEAA